MYGKMIRNTIALCLVGDHRAHFGGKILKKIIRLQYSSPNLKSQTSLPTKILSTSESVFVLTPVLCVRNEMVAAKDSSSSRSLTTDRLCLLTHNHSSARNTKQGNLLSTLMLLNDISTIEGLRCTISLCNPWTYSYLFLHRRFVFRRFASEEPTKRIP